MHLFVLYLIITTVQSATINTKDVREARESIKALISPLVPGQSKKMPIALKKFRVDTCEKHKFNCMDILMTKKTITLNYRFKEGCDIQGDITPKVLETFPASLLLRNLESYSKVESQNRVTAGLESRPIMFLEVRSGVLTGKKGRVLFEADYRVRLNPAKTNNSIENNLGGEIRITEIYGQKVLIKEKIKVE